VLALGALLLGGAGFGPAAGHAFADKQQRVEAGKLATDKGTLFARDSPSSAWQVVAEHGAVHSGDMLLALPGGAVDSKNGAVRLTFQGDLDEKSPLPIVDSAVILHPTTESDLDFTLDRGRVDVTNRREEGAARLRVSFHHEHWDLTLAEPGTRVAFEIFGRWAPGTRFVKEPKEEYRPCTTLIVLALHGKASLKTGKQSYELSAPPGNALIQWDCVSGTDEEVQKLDKLPSWAGVEDESSPLVKQKRAALEKFRELALSKGPHDAIADLLADDDANVRKIGVKASGAFDDLSLLGEALTAGKYPDLWESAVLTLRHWIGRNSEQLMKLYQTLLDKRGYSPKHADIVLQLLHSFDDTDLSRPELYEALIAYLKHDKVAVRGLAWWHLTRLVPAGKKIAYNPSAKPEELNAAYEEWKKLVPSGKLPARVVAAESDR